MNDSLFHIGHKARYLHYVIILTIIGEFWLQPIF